MVVRRWKNHRNYDPDLDQGTIQVNDYLVKDCLVNVVVHVHEVILAIVHILVEDIVAGHAIDPIEIHMADAREVETGKGVAIDGEVDQNLVIRETIDDEMIAMNETIAVNEMIAMNETIAVNEMSGDPDRGCHEN